MLLSHQMYKYNIVQTEGIRALQSMESAAAGFAEAKFNKIEH